MWFTIVIIKNTEAYARGFRMSGMLISDQSWGHAAHYQMARTAISLRVVQRQDRRTQNGMRM